MYIKRPDKPFIGIQWKGDNIDSVREFLIDNFPKDNKYNFKIVIKENNVLEIHIMYMNEKTLEVETLIETNAFINCFIYIDEKEVPRNCLYIYSEEKFKQEFLDIDNMRSHLKTAYYINAAKNKQFGKFWNNHATKIYGELTEYNTTNAKWCYKCGSKWYENFVPCMYPKEISIDNMLFMEF